MVEQYKIISLTIKRELHKQNFNNLTFSETYLDGEAPSRLSMPVDVSAIRRRPQ